MKKFLDKFKKKSTASNSILFDIQKLAGINASLIDKTDTQVILSRKGYANLGTFFTKNEDYLEAASLSPIFRIQKHGPGGSFFGEIENQRIIQLDLRATQQIGQPTNRMYGKALAHITLSHELGHAQQSQVFSVSSVLNKKYDSIAKMKGLTFAIEEDAWNRAEQQIESNLTQSPIWQDFKEKSLKSYNYGQHLEENIFKSKDEARYNPIAKEELQKTSTELLEFNKGKKIGERYIRIKNTQNQVPLLPRSNSTRAGIINPSQKNSLEEGIAPYSQERGINFAQFPKEDWEKLERIVEVDGKIRIFRGSPTGAEIQPGDMVVLNPERAVKYTQLRNTKGEITYAGQDYDSKINYLDVDPSHINFAKTAGEEFFYDPPASQANLKPDASAPKRKRTKSPFTTKPPAVKAAEEAIEEVKIGQTAAHIATDHTAGVAERKAATEVVKEVAEKTKTSLSHAGLLGIGGAGFLAYLAMSRNSRKNEIAPRRREGRVREHYNPDTLGRSSRAGVSAFVGATIAGIGLASKKLSPSAAGFMGIGGAVLTGIGLGIARRDDPSVTALAMAGAGAAATLAYVKIQGSTSSGKGPAVLASFFKRQGASSVAGAADNAINNAFKNFPGLKGLIGIGAGLITIPMAHSIMVKHFASEKRRTTDHGDTAFMASWQDNKAGHTGMKKSNAPLFANNPSNSAHVNFSGSVQSYYNPSSAFESVH